jgi:hypothetical protein
MSEAYPAISAELKIFSSSPGERANSSHAAAPIST